MPWRWKASVTASVNLSGHQIHDTTNLAITILGKNPVKPKSNIHVFVEFNGPRLENCVRKTVIFSPKVCWLHLLPPSLQLYTDVDTSSVLSFTFTCQMCVLKQFRLVQRSGCAVLKLLSKGSRLYSMSILWFKETLDINWMTNHKQRIV